MLELVRRNQRFFLIAALAGVLLRIVFLVRFPAVVNDSFVYGDIAKNWLQHGIYGLSGPDEISPTYIRLPGYPAFLAIIFAIFGMEHYRAVLIVQIFFDLGTCFLCADIARRLFGAKFAKAAFVLAALCPFLADYSAAALSETLEIFFTAAALDAALSALAEGNVLRWCGCGILCAGAIQLRPDGALLLMSVAAYLVWKAAQQGKPGGSFPRGKLITAAALTMSIAAATLIPWTIRNWRVFQRFEPLAPRYANEEGEFVPDGFNRWVKTWIADYTSVEEIYWQVPGSPIDPDKLPSRAVDNAEQSDKTAALIANYNTLLHISPDLDKGFAELAAERVKGGRLRYYVELPALRILDMWLRPRTEMLPSDSRWWEFNDERRWSALAISFGAINLGYVLCGIVGWMMRRSTPLIGLPILFVALRSLFLGTLENPEPRYTLEMYPVIIVLAAGAFWPRTSAQED